MIAFWQIPLFILWIVAFSGIMFDSFRNWFYMPHYFCLYLLGFSFLSSFLLVPFIKKLAHRFNALDIPDVRKVHSHPTPLLGGLAIYFSFLTSILSSFYFSQEIMGVLFAVTLIVMMGVVDDIKGLSSVFRLGGQIIATSILLFYGIKLDLFPHTFWGHFFDYVLTYLWVIGIINAFNFIDGLDGLATGIGAISALIFIIIAFQNDQRSFMILGVALMGACIGFLPYNMKRQGSASIFLGDSGSTFIGFLLAAFGLMGEWAENNTIKAISIPVLILGVLIFDLGYTMIARIVTKKVHSIREFLDYTGKDHLHHRLLAVGLSPWQTVWLIYMLNIVFGLTAIMLKNGRTVDAFLGVGQMVMMLTSITILMRKGADLLYHKNN